MHTELRFHCRLKTKGNATTPADNYSAGTSYQLVYLKVSIRLTFEIEVASYL